MINLQLPQIHIVPFAAIHRIRLHPQLLYSKEAVKKSSSSLVIRRHWSKLEVALRIMQGERRRTVNIIQDHESHRTH